MPRKREKSKGTEGQRELADRPDVAPVRDRRKPVSVFDTCRTPTRRQKWRVGATALLDLHLND